MAQLTGIKPTTTLGQELARLMARPVYTRPVQAQAPTRQQNTGKRGKSYTGIPGIAYRREVFQVISHENAQRVCLGSFVNLRTAIQILADHKGCQPHELRGVSENMWNRLAFQQKFLPNHTKRGPAKR